MFDKNFEKKKILFWFFKCVHSPNADVQLNMQKKSSLYSPSEGQCLYFIFLEFSCSLTGGWNATERANDFPLYIALHDGQRLPIIFISWKFSRTFMLSKNISRKLSASFMSLKEYFLENFQNLQARLSSNVGRVPTLARQTLAFMKEANVCVLKFVFEKIMDFF